MAAEALRASLHAWRAAMQAQRHENRLAHLGARFRVRVLRLHALRRWGERVRLARVRRLRGAANFDLLRRQWTLWRSALASRRLEAQQAKQAAFHRQWHGLTRALAAWRGFVHSAQRGRALAQHADAFCLQHSGVRMLHQWSRHAQTVQLVVHHRASALQFRTEGLLSRGLRALQSAVVAARARAQQHRQVRLFQRQRVVAQWRRFSHARAQAYEHARLARRFAYLCSLRTAMLGWRHLRAKERAIELRLMSSRAEPLISRMKAQLFRHWSLLAASSRSAQRKWAVAVQLDRTAVLQNIFSWWRDRFHTVRSERQAVDLAERHRRGRLIARVVFAWDAFARQQRAIRAQVAEGMQAIRWRLDQGQRRALFAKWKARVEQRERHRQAHVQAELHHARCVLYRQYRQWQFVLARRQEGRQVLAQFTSKVNLRLQGALWSHWRGVLGARRRELHKHVLSLRFWSSRVLRTAWRGWARFHELQKFKAHLMHQALEHRRQKLRLVAFAQFVSAGMELHQRALLQAHQESAADGAFLSLHSRAAALKYGRLWRYLAHRNAQRDAQRGGIVVNRIVKTLPFVGPPPVFRPPPLPLRADAASASAAPAVSLWSDGEHKVGPPPPPSTTLEAASLLFPRLAPVSRPPPRRPLDLDIPVPLPKQLPLTDAPISVLAAYRGGVVVAAAPRSMLSSFALPPPVVPPPVVAVSSVSSSSSPPSFELLAPPAASCVADDATTSNDDDRGGGFDDVDGGYDPLLEEDVSALEDQLHRLLSWKSEVKQRKMQLRQLEQKLAAAALSPFDENKDPQQSHSSASAMMSRVESEHAALRRAVDLDEEHRIYWQEQVQQVQARLQQIMQTQA
jgi:hypothetical protein